MMQQSAGGIGPRGIHAPSAEIAVVIPVFRGRRWVEGALRSALAQRPATIIVVDDGCPDGTGDFVNSLALEGVLVLFQANSGVGAARNAGLAALPHSATFVVFLDQDDRLLPGALAVLGSALSADGSAVAVVGHAHLTDELGRDLTSPDWIDKYRQHKNLKKAAMRVVSAVNTPGQGLMRVDVVRRLGGFDPELAPCDDWDLWLRLISEGEVKVIGNRTINVVRHADNASNKVDVMHAAEWRSRRASFVRAGHGDRAGLALAYRIAELHYLLDELSKAPLRGSSRMGFSIQETHLLSAGVHFLFCIAGFRFRMLYEDARRRARRSITP